MKTIYIDVYFLINFTVDILALYFASLFSKIKSSVWRIIISGVIGGMYAVLGVLLIDNKMAMPIFSVAFMIIMVLITASGVSLVRKIKYMISFVFFQILIGGIVYYGYCLLDKIIKPENLENLSGQNKKFLILALFVLLAAGMLKILISTFSNTRIEQNIRIQIIYKGRSKTFDAFIDSGNLAVDPLDQTPVMLLSEMLSKEIFMEDFVSIRKTDDAEYDIKKRIRLIPVKCAGNFKMLYGIKNCEIYALNGKQKEKLSLVVAIDEGEESYGGYPALVPLSAVCDVL